MAPERPDAACIRALVVHGGHQMGRQPTVRSDAFDQSGYESALAELPDAHALALRLVDAGTSDDEICRQLGIESEALAPLLDLAARKLHAKLTTR